jgi:hypothetical protein
MFLLCRQGNSPNVTPNYSSSSNSTTGTVTLSAHRLIPRDQTTAAAAAAVVVGAPAAKRRRVSASSSDSGLEEQQGKYPRLELNDEERRMALKEGMSFPKYYPLSR